MFQSNQIQNTQVRKVEIKDSQQQDNYIRQTTKQPRRQAKITKSVIAHNNNTISQVSEDNKIRQQHTQQHYNHLGQRKQQNPEKHTTTLQSLRLAKTTISVKTHNKIIIIQVRENNNIRENAQHNYNHLDQRKQQNLEKHTTTLQSPRLAKTTISGKTHNNLQSSRLAKTTKSGKAHNTITIIYVSENNKIWKNTQQNYNHLGQRKQQNPQKRTTKL